MFALFQLAAIGSLLPVDGFHNVIIDLSDQNQGLNRPVRINFLLRFGTAKYLTERS